VGKQQKTPHKSRNSEKRRRIRTNRHFPQKTPNKRQRNLNRHALKNNPYAENLEFDGKCILRGGPEGFPFSHQCIYGDDREEGIGAEVRN